MFLLSRQDDLAVSYIQKVGTQTFYEWLGHADKEGKRRFVLVDNDVAMEATVRVAFFRHPIERLKSCYSFLHWLREYGHKTSLKAPTTSWEDFVDFTLEHDDLHWREQVRHVGSVPTVYHKFENLKQHWQKYMPGMISCNNMSTRLPTTSYKESVLLEKYADDLRIWEAAT